MKKYIELGDGILYKIIYSDNEYNPFDKNGNKESFVIAPDMIKAVEMFKAHNEYILILSVELITVYAIIDTESINTEREFEY